MAATLPESVNLGLGPSIKVVRVSVREMRKAAKCERIHTTPDGLWVDDDNSILVLEKLSKRRAIEAFFHEMTHALADVSWWVMHP